MRQTRNSAAGSKALAAGIALVAFTTFVAATAPAIAADWPCWRGRDGEGIWRGVSLPSRLTGDRVEKRWSVPIGGGYSGIAVVGSRVLTMDRPGKEVDEERVVCLDRDSGRTLWERRSAAKYGDLDHDNGPRATPTIDGGHVFAFGAVGRLACLELETGKPIWEVDVVGELNGKLPIWGHAASPVVRDGRVVVQAGARPGGTIVAFDRRTGKELWRARDDRPGYSTPITLRAGGIEQLVCWTADTVVALAPATGRAIWEMPFRTSNYDVAIISPVFRRCMRTMPASSRGFSWAHKSNVWPPTIP